MKRGFACLLVMLLALALPACQRDSEKGINRNKERPVPPDKADKADKQEKIEKSDKK